MNPDDMRSASENYEQDTGHPEHRRTMPDFDELRRAGPESARAHVSDGSDDDGPWATAVATRCGRVRQGKSVSLLGRADRPHTWSFTEDVARMLVVAGTDPRAWGRAWHVPSNEPLSQRQVIDDFAQAAQVQVRVGTLSPVLMHGMGLVWPLMRELRETEYQFRDDFIMDSSAAQATFGLKPTPWEEVVAATVRPVTADGASR